MWAVDPVTISFSKPVRCCPGPRCADLGGRSLYGAVVKAFVGVPSGQFRLRVAGW